MKTRFAMLPTWRTDCHSAISAANSDLYLYRGTGTQRRFKIRETDATFRARKGSGENIRPVISRSQGIITEEERTQTQGMDTSATRPRFCRFASAERRRGTGAAGIYYQ